MMEEEISVMDETSVENEMKPVAEVETEDPEHLVRQGLSFFNNLARTLSSPESTQKLLNSIIEEDKETGQTSLRIPVPDKQSVATVLNLFGKLISSGK